MSEEGAHTRTVVPIAASLAEFTDKVIARRGVEQSNLLFGGQIGPATQALSARTNSIGVGDPAPDFSLPTAEAGAWSPVFTFTFVWLRRQDSNLQPPH